MKNKNKIISWLLVLSWMALIFYLSHQPATQSSSLSSGITQRIIKVIEKIAPNLELDWEAFHHFIRKNAHFFIYLVLGVLVVNSLRAMDYPNLTGYQLVGLAVLICVLYAISDEMHQIFIPGRAGQIKDVMIDSGGAIVGIILGTVSTLA